MTHVEDAKNISKIFPSPDYEPADQYQYYAYDEDILPFSNESEVTIDIPNPKFEFIIHGVCITSVGLAGLVANAVCLLVLRQPALNCGRQVIKYLYPILRRCKKIQ